MELVFNLKAIPKARARVTSRGTYTPWKSKQFEKELKWLLIGQLPRPWKMMEKPIEMKISFVFKKPKSVPKTRVFPTVKPDLDNIVKSVKDAFNGMLWKDDAQVVICNAQKVYGTEDKIHVSVYEIDTSSTLNL